LKDIEADCMSTILVEVMAILTVTIGVFCLSKLANLHGDEMENYPNYLYLYFLDLLAPSCANFLLIFSFFRTKKLRRSAKEELFNCIS
jgi:hypothetical protein